MLIKHSLIYYIDKMLKPFTQDCELNVIYYINSRIGTFFDSWTNWISFILLSTYLFEFNI